MTLPPLAAQGGETGSTGARENPRHPMKRIHLLPAVVVLLFTGCSQYAVVEKTTPLLHTGTQADQRLVLLAKTAESHPMEAVVPLLEAASGSARALSTSRTDGAALQDYNYAVARLCDAVHNAGLDPWNKPLQLAGGWTLAARLHSKNRVDPHLFNLEPADQFVVKGTYVQSRSVREGLGAPLVVSNRVDDATKIDRFAQAKKTFYGTTAVARFQGKNCMVTIEDPLGVETVEFGGRRFPLAADFTTPLAISLAAANPKKLELLRLLNPQKYEDTARLARLQPYDPNKIPVLCVHGLMDSQATWVPMINTLRGDPEIRKHYQFWFFSYPSGYPYPLSASILRKDMDGIDAAYPGHKKEVLIGHSMGGMISRLIITDSGDTLWRTIFGKSPAETKLSPEARKTLEPALIFRHRPDVARVIFIASPLKGADMAKGWIGRLGSKLVKAPAKLLSIGGEAMKLLVPAQPGMLEVKSVPNSVDTLASNNRFVKAINTIPVTPGIPYHTIMGDRGKGDAPNSSDGLVPYWSSHMDGAQSEKIVPSGHSAHQNPEAIAEVMRILKLHARK
jgi:pimeloyl-ACP methyl ester carboxylesterase